MTNRIFFINDFAEAKMSLGLAVNRLNQEFVSLLADPQNSHAAAEISADLARVNDIAVNAIGFASITANDICWVVERTDAYDLWDKERCEQFVNHMLLSVKGTKVIWFNVDDYSWNINEPNDAPVVLFGGFLFDLIEFVAE